VRPGEHAVVGGARANTTLGCLRRARQEWRTAKTLASHGLDPDTSVGRSNANNLIEPDPPNGNQDTVLVPDRWTYAGRGHSVGEAVFARTIADDIAENRRICRQVAHDDELQGE
jgi:hypothetical protein